MFCFQSLTKADDLSDFEIEGMSIGDSLLNFINKKQIIKSKRNYFADERKYYAVGYDDNLKRYDTLDIYLSSDDKDYIIKGITGFKFMNMNKCLLQKKTIVNQISELFKNTKKHDNPSATHEVDTTGKSIEDQTAFLLDGNLIGNFVKVSCMDWSNKITKEKNWSDNLGISATSNELSEWMNSGYK
tara:strand:+ start:923 stop:1480 length:558 start_codon:yes stop_codon:yes gene_type:complete